MVKQAAKAHDGRTNEGRSVYTDYYANSGVAQSGAEVCDA